MFDIGGMELLVLAIVAIVVVGPKELPRMLRTVGQFVGKAKMMAREFQQHFNDAAADSGLDDVRRDISDAVSGRNYTDAVKPFTEAGDQIRREIEKSAKGDPVAATDTTSDQAAEPEPAEASVAGTTKREKVAATGAGDETKTSATSS